MSSTLVFGATIAAYVFAAVAHILSIYRRDWERVSLWGTRLAWVLHTLELVFIVVENKRPPLLSLYETAIFLTWVLILNYLLWEMLMKAQGVGTFLIPVTLGLLLGALLLPRTEPNLALTRSSGTLVGWHIAVSLGAYGLLLMSFVTAAAYLFQAKQLRDKAFRPIYYRLPPLEALDRWSHRFVLIGFPVLTVGLASGLALARLEWSGDWTLDAKILWSVLSWIIYAGYLIVRYRWGWAGRRAAFWSVVGFSALVANYFLINLFATELHRWGL